MLSTVLRRWGCHETIRAVAKHTLSVDARAVNRVCSWFEGSARTLPWRDTSPWGVMVSEFMLQQTPVVRVEPVWRQWLERWPAPSDLAAEPAGSAVRAWGRLGYPRRALRLHSSAQILASDFDDQVPDDQTTLRSLPGVGEYTAAAICAFAFGQPTVVLDVNVRRVLSRAWTGIAEPPTHLTAVERSLANALVDAAADGAAWAAASMELGAIVCTRKEPSCDVCPLRRMCRWVAEGKPEQATPRKTQARFEGSDRQARGRMMRMMREAHGSVTRGDLLAILEDEEQAKRALASLEADGLLRRRRSRYSLPE
jgi:A/G-specific adenine glycosylase